MKKPMGDAGYAVHLETLDNTSRAAATTASSLAGEIDGNFAGCTAAVAGHPGWSSASALQECAQAWVAHLHGHVADMQITGNRLAATHATYREADGSVNDHVKRVAGALPPAEEV
jgi:hypothetical protein